MNYAIWIQERFYNHKILRKSVSSSFENIESLLLFFLIYRINIDIFALLSDLSTSF